MNIMLCCYIPITNLRHDLLRKKYLRILADKSKLILTFAPCKDKTLLESSFLFMMLVQKGKTHSRSLT